MASRLELQSILEELLNSRNVYYQPPGSVKMQYPAIRYSINKIDKRIANDSTYSILRSYELIVIDTKPDNPVIDKLLALPYCAHNTAYKADNLYHDVLTLYY